MSDLGSAKTSSSVSESSNWNPLCCCGAPWVDLAIDDTCSEFTCCEQVDCSFMDGVAQTSYVSEEGGDYCIYEYTYPEPVVCSSLRDSFNGYHKVQITYGCYEGHIYYEPLVRFLFEGIYNGVYSGFEIARYGTPLTDVGCDKEMTLAGANPFPGSFFISGCKWPDTVTVGFN